MTTTELAAVDDWVSRYRRWAIVVAYAVVFLGSAARGDNGFVQVLAALVGASAITLACMLDARLHGKVYIRSFGYWLFFTWPVGVLVHLIWTRRSRGIVVYLALVGVYLLVGVIGLAFARIAAGTDEPLKMWLLRRGD